METQVSAENNGFSGATSQLDCFRSFDSESKQYLNKDDFCKLFICILKDGNSFNDTLKNELFDHFDVNKDRKIDFDEFKILWDRVIQPLIHPVTALVIVDVQNDFTTGALALKNCPAKQDGVKIIPIINQLLENIKFDAVVYSIDSHPEDHISFFENRELYELSDKNKKNLEDIKVYDVVTFAGPPEIEQTLWPRHCVKNTDGSQLHPDLQIVQNSIFVHKGEKSNIDSYSAFWDNMKVSQTELHQELVQRQVTHVFVCGLAFDYCVGYTALDAVDLGFATVLVEDASCGTDISNIETMKKRLVSNSCVLAQSKDVMNLVNSNNTFVQFAKVLGNGK